MRTVALEVAGILATPGYRAPIQRIRKMVKPNRRLLRRFRWTRREEYAGRGRVPDLKIEIGKTHRIRQTEDKEEVAILLEYAMCAACSLTFRSHIVGSVVTSLRGIMGVVVPLILVTGIRSGLILAVRLPKKI